MDLVLMLRLQQNLHGIISRLKKFQLNIQKEENIQGKNLGSVMAWSLHGRVFDIVLLKNKKKPLKQSFDKKIYYNLPYFRLPL